MIAVNKRTPEILFLALYNDDSPEDPCAMGEWTVHSFSPRHNAYKDPQSFDFDAMRPQFEEGSAFMLSYFEHGQCQWSLQDEGADCPWDSVSKAGILVWQGKPEDMPGTLEERREWARGFLKTYTDWCNGEVYGYALTDEAGEHVDGCSGYYGHDLDYMFQEIRRATNGATVKVLPDCGASGLADSYRATTGEQTTAKKIVTYR